VIPERDVVRVEPLGEIDLATAPTVALVLEDLRTTGFRQVVLDLKGVTFIDSSGMRMVVEARAAAERDGAHLTVLPGPPPVQRSFDMTGLTPLVFT
jgi:anti-anti-sigma factor